MVAYQQAGEVMKIDPPATVSVVQAGGQTEQYQLQVLPDRLVNRYRYAQQFVELVRSKTAKITYYSASCRFCVSI
jgi:hypothetical protein